MSEGTNTHVALRELLATPFRAAIFDMDGTLLDTERHYFRAWRQAAARLGERLDEAHYSRLIGTSDEDGLKVLRELWARDFDGERFLDDALRHFRESCKREGVGVRPGAKALLAVLRERQVRRVVATSTFREKAKESLASEGLLQEFEFVLGGDDVPRRKPDPAPFLMSLQRLGVEPTEAIVFEDSPAGVLAAQVAGLRCIWVPDLANTEHVRRLSTTVICSSLEDVVSHL